MPKKTIMVVDDNKDIRYSIIQAIKSSTNDYDFIEAEDGQICVDKIKKGAKLPNILLLDIMMPNMDGWDVAANLKSDPKYKSIPIIFLTAKTDDLSRGMGKITGEYYITKPFDTQELNKKIKKILS